MEAADPFILKEGSFYYLYATNNIGNGIEAWRSTNLVEWRSLGLVYDPSKSETHAWGNLPYWGGNVVKKDGKFYMFYNSPTIAWGNSGHTASQRIGIAVSSHPAGPFIDTGAPLTGPAGFNYTVIDAFVFRDDDGKYYMYFSRDNAGNTVGGRMTSEIYAAELADDFLSLTTLPVKLASPADAGTPAWEDVPGGNSIRWNEAPCMYKHNGTYYLFYTANDYSSRYYSVGYATSNSPLGPYTKYANNPILTAVNVYPAVSGSGSNCVIEGPQGDLWIAYHVHVDPAVGGGLRKIAIDRMEIKPDGTLVVRGPTWTPQEAP
jgi:beta-xylosidase